MQYLADGCLVVLSAPLLLAAAGKAVGSSSARDMLRDLGVPRRLVTTTLWAAIFAEAGMASWLVVSGGDFAALLGTGLLFAVFAIVGSRSLLLGSPVRCACFGIGANRSLGSRQIIQLPVALAALAVVGSRSSHFETPLLGLQLLGVIQTTLALLLSSSLLPLAIRFLRLRLDYRT